MLSFEAQRDLVAGILDAKRGGRSLTGVYAETETYIDNNRTKRVVVSVGKDYRGRIGLSSRACDRRGQAINLSTEELKKIAECCEGIEAIADEAALMGIKN